MSWLSSGHGGDAAADCGPGAVGVAQTSQAPDADADFV